jgi:hypothetical protein
MRWRLAGDGIFVHAGTGIDPAEFVNDPAAALRGLFVPSEIASRDRVAQAYRIGTSYDPVYTHGDEVWFSVLYQPDGNMDEVEVQMIQADDWGNPTGSIYTRTLPAQDLNRPGSVATINEGPGFAGEGGSPLWMMSHELGSPSDITYHAESGMGYYHLTLLTDNTPHPDDFLMQARLFANESEEAVLPPYNYYVVGRHSSPFVRQAIVEAGTVASQQYATSGTVAVSYTLDYYSGTPIYAIVANLTLDDGSKWYGTYSGPIEFGVPPAETILTEDNFPDANFLAALRTLASENNWDRNGDGAIDADEAVQVTEIGVAENGIDDLTGVEHFTSLTKLDCSSNNLTELNLSANTALAYFDCENNPGNEGLFTVKVWENFDTASLPESFTNTGWTYNGSEIELAYTTMM